MLVFWKERLTFLAVPKTGSTAYAEALGPRADIVVRDPPELRHAPLYRYDRFFRPLFEARGATDMATLAVMREPVAWLSSWYRYRRRAALRGAAASTESVSFDEFALAWCETDPPAFARVGSQARFLAPRRKGRPVTHLFRHDDLQALDGFLERRLGGPVAVARVNASPVLETALSEDVEARLRDVRAADFALWQSIPDGGRHLTE